MPYSRIVNVHRPRAELTTLKLEAFLKIRPITVVALLAASPAVAAANTATSQSVVSMTIQGSSCSITNNGDPNFGVLSNPITAVEYAQGNVSVSCGSSSPAVKIAFNDAANTGTFNFTMTNSTTTTATEPYQICDWIQFNYTTCPNGYEYKNTTSDAHALPSTGSQGYAFVAYFTPPTGGLNLTSGAYFDTVTETITF